MLKDINFDLDDCANTVNLIEIKVGSNKARTSSPDPKTLLENIDRELNSTGKYGRTATSNGRARNFHPPDSPVRRTFENGVEVDLNDRSSPGKQVGF